jgi:iron complex outermembrane receptor protein
MSQKNRPIKTLLSVSIALALSSGAVQAQEEAGTTRIIEEIVVTATKRAKAAQDIPITVQAIGEEALEDLNIGNFEDYIRHLPGVTSAGQGPGQMNVFIRGVSTGKGNVKVSGALLEEPNVAFYLDEAPISMGGRSLDPYMTDMARVEVLPGPQGTLFGASSQAGTVRLITNKPVYNDFEAGFVTSISNTHKGEMSNSVEAHLNFPLIDDKLAARIAIYNVKEGGFIDNVPGSKQIENPIVAATPRSAREIITNTTLAGNDFNDATFMGFRGGLKYAINDDWEVLVQHTHQGLETEGVWDYDPLLGDLKTQTFTPSNAEDIWDHTSWTVTGRLANLDLIYTGAYLDRTREGKQDYTGYADSGPFMPYYICDYPGYAFCGTPDLNVIQFLDIERTNHEFRVTTDPDKRVRLIAGVFMEDFDTIERGDWSYPAAMDVGFDPNAPFPTATSSNPNTRSPDIVYFNDYTKGKEELSFFGELTFDITDNFSAMIGARSYDIDISLNGSSNYGQRTEGDSGTNIDVVLAGQSPANLSDTIYKASLQWFANEDAMLYATWSEGYRPGGFNRNGGSGNAPNFIPYFFESDELENIEYGWKTSWRNNSLRFNGSVYSLKWDGMQVASIDFTISNLTFIGNIADAEIQGLEADLVWLPTDELSLFVNVSFNDSELTNVPSGVQPTSPVGSQLALAPDLQYALRARYDWPVNGGYEPFAQVGVQYSDDTPSSLILNNQFQQDAYTTLDASFGVHKDNWSATLFVENLTDERAEVFIDNQDYVVRITTNRPRTIGLRFSYDYDGGF